MMSSSSPSPHPGPRSRAAAAVRRCAVVALLALSLPTAPAGAQTPADTAYVPSMQLPEGRQVVAVYLGAQSCGPCRQEATKAAILRMKPLLAAQARRSGAAFAAKVVSLDWDLKTALEFVQPLGAFDEYLLGANWVSSAAERYFWSDSLTAKALPQVIVLERTVAAGARGITFGPEQVVRRVYGDSGIIQWVRAGAPMSR